MMLLGLETSGGERFVVFGKRRRGADARAAQPLSKRRDVDWEMHHKKFVAQETARMKICDELVYPAALEQFRVGLPGLPPKSEPEFEPMLWLLHFETLANACYQRLSDDLTHMPLTIWRGTDDGETVVSQGWIKLMNEQADLVRLHIDDFGLILSDGFVRIYEKALSRERNVQQLAPSTRMEAYAASFELRKLLNEATQGVYVTRVLALRYSFVFDSQRHQALMEDA